MSDKPTNNSIGKSSEAKIVFIDSLHSKAELLYYASK